MRRPREHAQERGRALQVRRHGARDQDEMVELKSQHEVETKEQQTAFARERRALQKDINETVSAAGDMKTCAAARDRGRELLLHCGRRGVTAERVALAAALSS